MNELKFGNLTIRQFGNLAIRQFGNSTIRQFGNSAIRQFDNSANRVPIILSLPKHINLLEIIDAISHFNLRFNGREVNDSNDSGGVKLL